MRYVGRIITNTKIDDISEFIEVTKDTSSIVNNEAKIPTLIIGYKNAQEICGNIKILEKKIGKNLYWTFSKRERRVDYDPDLRNFMLTVSDFVQRCCKYEYVDILTSDSDKTGHLFNVLREETKKKVVYETNTMYYIYVPQENTVFGLSKEVLKYVKMDVTQFFKNNSVTTVIDHEFSDNKISKYKFVNPLLYYLKTF